MELHRQIVRRGESNISEIKIKSIYKYVMVISVELFRHFDMAFIVSGERNYGKISRFSSSKLRLFATLLTPINVLNREIIIQNSRNLDNM